MSLLSPVFLFTNPIAIGVLFFAGLMLPDIFVSRQYEHEVVFAIWLSQAVGYFWYSDNTGEFKSSLKAMLDQDYSEINQWKQKNPVGFKVLATIIVVLVLAGSLNYLVTPKSYSECVLNNMQGVDDARAVSSVLRACKDLYPEK
jgi:hypothetical protein|tara:strand:- start:97 stop:528 length:432 start_codon:yes stop_codon:yes gene_type:complete